MIIVTGATGFIGSNVVEGLNRAGVNEILAVDVQEKGQDHPNLKGLKFQDYCTGSRLRERISSGSLKDGIKGVLHQGACADTMETDENYMMDTNYEFSKELLHFSSENEVPFIYASSAAVYGINEASEETPENEQPLNIYGVSKLKFDNYVRSVMDHVDAPVVGFRYFNVFGPREEHKGRMASMVYQLYRQIKDAGVGKLFEGTGGYEAGEQRRDFIYVGDVVDVNLFFLEHGGLGIYNVGTGKSRSFNDIGNAIIKQLGSGKLEYIPFPASLEGKYQNFTEASLSNLRKAGYSKEFTSLESGINQSFF